MILKHYGKEGDNTLVAIGDMVHQLELFPWKPAEDARTKALDDSIKTIIATHLEHVAENKETSVDAAQHIAEASMAIFDTLRRTVEGEANHAIKKKP